MKTVRPSHKQPINYFLSDYRELWLKMGIGGHRASRLAGLKLPDTVEAMMSVASVHKLLDYFEVHLGEKVVSPYRPKKSSRPLNVQILELSKDPRYEGKPLSIAVALDVPYRKVVKVLALTKEYPEETSGFII